MKPVVLMTDSHAIQNKEVELIHLPFIGIRKLPVVKALRHNQYDWLIFTSKNAVELFYKDYPEIQADFVASIGKKTTQALNEKSIHVDFEPSTFNQEAFIAEAGKRFDGTSICLPCSLKARPMLNDFFESVGQVDRIFLYEPVEHTANIAQAVHLIEQEAIDVVVFLSPSAVDAFFKHHGPIDTQVVAIGHVTGAALNKYHQQYIVSEESTKESIIKKIIEMERHQ